MKKIILDQMEQLSADGIDFIAIQMDECPPKIYCSYTKEEFADINIIPKSNYKFYKIINGTKEYINCEPEPYSYAKVLNQIGKRLFTAFDAGLKGQVLPTYESVQNGQEQELLIEIAAITDSETARKAQDLLHSSKNVYNFDDYLFWLSELIVLLLRGTPTDKAFDRIWASIVKTYYFQEPLAIFRD